MAFPSNPSDGQQYTQNGFVYQYYASLNLWKKVSTASSTTDSATITNATITNANIEKLASLEASFENGISIGNTTVNTSIRSTFMFSGNTFANSYITPVSISVSNTSSNSTITSQVIFVGNTTANASFNLTGGAATINASRLSVNANGAVIIQTVSDHGLYGTGSIVGTLSSLTNFDRGWLNNPRILIANTPTPNTITFTLGSTVLANSSLKINAVKRINGLMTYETFTPHGLLVNDVINVTGIGSSIDSGKFNVVGGVVNTIPTSNTFTVYDSVRANKNIISSNTVSIFTPYVAFADAANIFVRFDLGFPHQIKISEVVTIAGITGRYGGGAQVGSNTGILNKTFNLNGTWTVTGVTANTFSILAFAKARNAATVSGGTANITYTSTFNATVNNDIGNTKITTVSYSSLPIISNIPVANGTVSYNIPIYINVGNTVSATKITPTSIFVGDLTGNSVVIDSAGTRYKRTGSILQTTVDGTGFGVTSVLDDSGTVVPDASAFFANTSVVSLGNSTSTTVLTQESVTTSNVFVGLDGTRVNITKDTISIEDNTSYVNTTITNYLASFPNDLYVGATLFVNAISDANGSIGSNGQVLTSNGSSVYWADSTGGVLGYTGSQGTQGPIGYTGSAGTGGGGGASVTISDTAPVSPSAGNLWWNSNTGELYIYYTDIDSSQWVAATSSTSSGSGGTGSGGNFAHTWFFGG